MRESIDEKDKGKASEKAGKLFNVGARYIQEAKRIKETQPELLEKIRSGEKTISEGALFD